MFPINSLSGALIQSAQIQLQQASEKSKLARKAEDAKKSVDTRDDELEHQVENSEELAAIHDQKQNAEQQRKQKHHAFEEDQLDEESSSGLDLTA